jgi:DNA-binding NarL/FixJ family response regulator
MTAPPVGGRTNGPGIRVAVAEDSVFFREGLVALLEASGIAVTGQAGDGRQLLQLVAENPPDVAIIDLRMPPTGTDEGLIAAQLIRSSHPGVGVLVLSNYADAPVAMRLLSNGSRGVGYLLKERVNSVELLGDALARLTRGESVVDPEIVDELLGAKRTRDIVHDLTERERAVLRGMAEGRSNAGIAAQLFLSERTVENHVAQIFRKLDLSAETRSNRRVLAVLEWLRRPG